MAAPVYATTDDLGDYLHGGTAPNNAGRYLTRASRVIDGALFGVAYPTDADGAPTDGEHIVALRDATCAQVEAWMEAGYEPGRDAAAAVTAAGPKSVTFGAVTITNNGGARATWDIPAEVRDRAAPSAVQILRDAGLQQLDPLIYG